MVETTTVNQITSPFHLFKLYLLCVSILVPSIVFTSFLGLGFHVTLFTTTILILSTSFLAIFSKKTKRQVEGEDEVDQEEVLQQPLLMNNTVSEAAQEVVNDTLNEYQVDEPLDLISESDQSSDDSGSSSVNLEMNRMISGNMEENPEISDEYSTSEDDYEDEEGLIEIAIPSNDSNFPTFLPESILQQQDLVELLAKINEVTEEENLIEIDISMGSIKCPSFEIEALKR